MTKAFKIYIFGQVQSVGYRKFLHKKGLELGLLGYVRNLEDGRVEVVAKGEGKAIEKLFNYCNEGPTKAVIEKIEIVEANHTNKTFENLGEFEVKTDL